MVPIWVLGYWGGAPGSLDLNASLWNKGMDLIGLNSPFSNLLFHQF